MDFFTIRTWRIVAACAVGPGLAACGDKSSGDSGDSEATASTSGDDRGTGTDAPTSGESPGTGGTDGTGDTSSGSGCTIEPGAACLSCEGQGTSVQVCGPP